MSVKSGSHIGGIRDLEDLRQRSRIDDETGCWVVQAGRSRGRVCLWLAVAQCSLPLTTAMSWLMTGKGPTDGKLWIPTCGNKACGNPAHRKLGSRGQLAKLVRPRLEPAQRAKIQRSHLRRSPHYSPERHAEILASSETGRELAKRLGMSPSTVSRVRRGETWSAAMVGSSVFTFAAAA